MKKRFKSPMAQILAAETENMLSTSTLSVEKGEGVGGSQSGNPGNPTTDAARQNTDIAVDPAKQISAYEMK